MRERVLDAAYVVLRARGVARATTKEIATKAGCSEGSVFTHFPTKPDLFLAVIAERLPGGEVFDSAPPTSVDALELLLGRLLAFYRDSIPIGLSLFGDQSLLEAHRERVSARDLGPHVVPEWLAGVLENLADGEVISLTGRPDHVAWTLVGALFFRVFEEVNRGGRPQGDDGEFVRGVLTSVGLAS